MSRAGIHVGLADRCGKDLVGGRVERSMAAVRTRTLSNDPRRIVWRMWLPSHVSTWFIQEADVVAKGTA